MVKPFVKIENKKRSIVTIDLCHPEHVDNSTLMNNFCIFSRICLKNLTEIFFCSSVQWLSRNQPYCGHCVRISIEGLMIDGSVKRKKRRRINWQRERLKLAKLYRNTHALSKRRLLERRIFNSYGIAFVG